MVKSKNEPVHPIRYPLPEEGIITAKGGSEVPYGEEPSLEPTPPRKDSGDSGDPETIIRNKKRGTIAGQDGNI